MLNLQKGAIFGLIFLTIVGSFYSLYSKSGSVYNISEGTPMYTYSDNCKLADSSSNLPNHFSKAITTNKIVQGQVPNVIVQYGKKRTATTLQFQIACVMMAMKYENNATNVSCKFKETPRTKFKVIKVHTPMPLLGKVPDGSWLFMTSNDERDVQDDTFKELLDIIKSKHIVVPYVADINLVIKRGYRIVYEYQKIFGLSNEQMVHVAEYFRYWDILRICCGKQMSKQWRNVLHQRNKDDIYNNTQSEVYHPCDIYNITNVEHFMLNSYIHKTFSRVASLKNVIGKPSLIDDKLDGTYCARCNKNISEKQLKMNKPCGQKRKRKH